MPNTRRSDILLDFRIHMLFLRGGTYNFNVDVRRGDKSEHMPVATRSLPGHCRLEVLLVPHEQGIGR